MITTRFRVLLAEKELRDGRKYTYRDIQNSTGVDKNTVGVWMTGNVKRADMATIEKFCKFLGCRMDQLIIISDDAPTNQKGAQD